VDAKEFVINKGSERKGIKEVHNLIVDGLIVLEKA
jgi:hypothetical protein